MIQPREDFYLYLKRRGNTEETIKTKFYVLHRLFRELPDLSLSHIEAWFTQELQRKKSSRYINIIVNALRVYGQFLGNKELAQIHFLPEEPAIKSTMSDEEILRFLSLPSEIKVPRHQHGKIVYMKVKPKWWNKYTMFWTIVAYSGMRTGEVAGLTIDDIDFGRNVFILEHTKIKQPRYVPIAPNVVERLKKYIAVLTTEYLFPANNQVGHFQVYNWVEDFDRRMKRLGIKRKGLTPYSLRHSFITRLLEEDVSIMKVMKIAGHTNIQTTVNYTHLTTKDIQQAITKHPLIRQETDPKSILVSLLDLIKSFHLENDPRFHYRIEENDNSIRFEVCLK